MAVQMGYYQTYINGPQNRNRNGYIQGLSDRLLDNTCPIVLRRFVEAQFSYQSKNLNQPDGQNVRIKILVASSVGAVFCLSTRVFRTAFRTLALPISIPYSLGKQHYYGLSGEVKEEFKRVWHEWFDLGVSLVLPFVGVAIFFKPDVASSFINNLSDYYVRRIDEREAHDNAVRNAISRFRNERDAINEAWDRGALYPAVVIG